jgi:hypothetical protein
VPRGGQRGRVNRPDPVPAIHDDLADPDVLTPLPNVAPSHDRGTDKGVAVRVELHVLAHDDGMVPFWYRITGVDAQKLSVPDLQPVPFGRTRGIDRSHRDTVHRRRGV